MLEKRYDKSLNIKTRSIREWPDGTIDYYRCESTSYKALECLCKDYKINITDRLVDFGSGSGRVGFFINNRFGIPVTGVEANIKVYEEAIENKLSYESLIKDIDTKVEFKHGLAQYYKIDPRDNKFYFFNPFSLKIFKDVVENILESVDSYRREIDIILYYPMLDYIKYLDSMTEFQLIKKIKLPGVKDIHQKFLIYNLR